VTRFAGSASTRTVSATRVAHADYRNVSESRDYGRLASGSSPAPCLALAAPFTSVHSFGRALRRDRLDDVAYPCPRKAALYVALTRVPSAPLSGPGDPPLASLAAAERAVASNPSHDRHSARP